MCRGLLCTPSLSLRLSFGVVACSVLLLLLSSSVQSSLPRYPNDFDDYYRFDDGFCEYYQLIEPGNKSYYLYSPGYPDAYRGTDLQPQEQAECRWFAKTSSPTDRLVLDCHVFDLPEVRDG